MRRELNEIEYFNWCVEQPYNMVVAVRLHGEIEPEQLRDALRKAQRRHPLLRVNTELGANDMPWFSSDGVEEIPLTVVTDADAEAPRRALERELVTPFARDESGSKRLPLARIALFVPHGSTAHAEIVFTVQHVIGDGLSMVFLVRDLLPTSASSTSASAQFLRDAIRRLRHVGLACTARAAA